MKKILVTGGTTFVSKYVAEYFVNAGYEVYVLNRNTKPENRKRYPENWKEIRKDILKRADNKCEFCGSENYTIRENGSKVVLTIAHLDHTPENCDYSNLRALCQKCHNKYDAKHRAETRRKAGATDVN